jgi:hypothetical protein
MISVTVPLHYHGVASICSPYSRYRPLERNLYGISHHTPHKIFQARFCHINVVPTRKPETWSLVTRAQIFVIFLETNSQNIINIVHNTRDIHN